MLGRQLAADPFLEKIGVLVLDEFHERHLQGDVALAVARELRRTVRPELKIAVMSATLDSGPIAAFLGDCPVIDSPGRAFPVEVDYQAEADDRPLAGRVAAALRRALNDESDRGDVLVFLPGAAEIRRAAAAVAELASAHDLEIVLLHGDLPLEAQLRALRPAARRKVILSTNVAETSLTIEGVTTVIDSGLARRGELDARLGINRLQILPISRAAAEQRAGRAGRTAPGRCFRLWTQHDHAGRRADEVAEVHRLDLSPTLLELRAWGLRDAGAFSWLEPPRPAALRAAASLLAALGAVGEDGELTAIGRRMSEIPAHPRAARLLVEAQDRGVAVAGAGLAALISERDILAERRAFAEAPSALAAASPSDLLARLELLERAAASNFDTATCRHLGVEAGLARAAARARAQLLRAGRSGEERERESAGEEALLRCVLVAYPDRLARRRASDSPRAVMVGGTGVRLAEHSAVRDAPLFVAVDLQAGERRAHSEAVVHIASAVREEWLEEMLPHLLRREKVVELDAAGGRVVAVARLLYADLVLAERRSVDDVDADAARPLLCAAALADPGRCFGDLSRLDTLGARLRFLARHMPELELPADPDGAVRGGRGSRRCRLPQFRRDAPRRCRADHARHADPPAGARSRQRSAGALRPAERPRRRDRLRTRSPAVDRRQDSGAVRPGGDAAPRRRARAAGGRAAGAERPSGAGHRRSRQLLAEHLPGGAQAVARPLSKARLAGGPAPGGAVEGSEKEKEGGVMEFRAQRSGARARSRSLFRRANCPGRHWHFDCEYDYRFAEHEYGHEHVTTDN